MGCQLFEESERLWIAGESENELKIVYIAIDRSAKDFVTTMWAQYLFDAMIFVLWPNVHVYT